jgi:tRNA(fMet)-specific endonuclease VapC
VSRLLLDTSAYAAFKGGHALVKAALQQAEEIYLNPVVLGELLAGFRQGSRRSKNEEELRAFLSSPRVHVVDVTEETAARYAVILNALRDTGTPIPTNDVWIAASAMEHGLRVLTMDAHYQNVGQVVVDYFGQI